MLLNLPILKDSCFIHTNLIYTEKLPCIYSLQMKLQKNVKIVTVNSIAQQLKSFIVHSGEVLVVLRYAWDHALFAIHRRRFSLCTSFRAVLYSLSIFSPPPPPNSLLILLAIEFKDWPPGGKNSFVWSLWWQH